MGNDFNPPEFPSLRTVGIGGESFSAGGPPRGLQDGEGHRWLPPTNRPPHAGPHSSQPQMSPDVAKCPPREKDPPPG